MTIQQKCITSRYILCIFLTLSILSGCSSIRPSAPLVSNQLQAVPQTFDYAPYADVLKTYVNGQGMVDYSGLQKNPANLEAFYAQLAVLSPDSHPWLFPRENDRLAYWINAYNSTVLKGIIEYYPIGGVEDVKEPLLLFFFPAKSGFFFFQRYTYGGVETNLYYVENRIIRKRFSDPRFHFALNCASRSCPKLPVTPFYPDTLDQQLDSEARKFINSREFVRFDSEHNTLYLSAIFKWYKEDFLDWLRLKKYTEPSLLAYIRLYAGDHLAIQLHNVYQPDIRFLDYDWSLNDQGHKQNQ